LTIDSEIQKVAERAAAEHLKKGAVVVMEIPTGKVRASVSLPAFDQNNVAASLSGEDSPMLNRAVSAYDVGSTFKLVVAACALDRGISPDFCHECTGSAQIGENIFHCSDRIAHGTIAMDKAIEVSCNTYFIALAQQLGGEAVLEYASRFGLGQEIQLAHDYATAAGLLPTPRSLELPAALANFSFGQGELLATPMHIASIIGTIANGGREVTPVLLEGVVDSDKNYISRPVFVPGEQVCSPESAGLIGSFMRMSVIEGTGRFGASERVDCAAKTGTAQTGMTVGGKQVLQAWYAGFFPYDSPKYVVVVLAENRRSGGRDAGPVFKTIADAIG
ncbi:MAG: penicillin-binding transpeptidase domain-containing protein, partial [Oscillospiraceae bacterium]|nr:penicillin-binding transpeptidase domain-containing protein [Oscillospiraceae bacterium]